MGTLRYRDIQWDDIDKPIESNRAKIGEIITWFIVGISFICVIIFLIPFEDMNSNADELVQKYPRIYPWLNRCSVPCEQKVNVSYIHAQQSCGALYGLYSESHNSDLLAWRTALDDRLTFLRCSGFPRLSDHILGTVISEKDQKKEQQKQWREKQEGRMQYEEARQIERYKQSLHDGGLLQFISSVEEFDENTLFLILHSSWFRIKEDRQEQMNEVLWQKWATIHSLHAPMQSRIQLFNKSGEVVGGSYKNGNHQLWLR